MSSSANMGMDLSFRNISDNYDEVRDRTAFPNLQSFKASSISSSKSLVAYHVRMENNNNLEDNVNMKPIDNFQLSYVIPMEQDNQVSTAANPNSNTIQQHVLIDCLALNSTITSSSPCVDEDSIINI